MLLKSRTGIRATVSHVLGSCVSERGTVTTKQVQLGIGVRVQLSDVELDKANQTIGALRFENNFLAEKTKKLEAELFQVRAKLERTSSAKLDEMLRI